MTKDQKIFKNISRISWLSEEDKLLKRIYEDDGVKSWKQIESLINLTFPERPKTAKQYRERYINYLRFNNEKQRKGCWTQEQDQAIFQKYMQVGSKWVQISKFISGRSQNSVKNRFYSTIKKLMRKINCILYKNKSEHKIKKPIREESIFKLLSIQNIEQQNSLKELEVNDKKMFIQSLKCKCLNMAKRLSSSIDDHDLMKLGIEIHKFNIITRFQSFKRSRNSSVSKRKVLPPLSHHKNHQNLYLSDQIIQKSGVQTAQKDIQQNNQTQNALGNTFIKQKPSQYMQLLINQSQQKKQRREQKDLQYQLSLILGIKYQSQQFKFVDFDNMLHI